MELELREWIMVASAVLMVAVVAPGFWMRWRSRRNRLRLDIERNLAPRDAVDELELLRAELPAGGGRPARLRQEQADRARAEQERADRESERATFDLDDAQAGGRDQTPPVLLNPLKSRGAGRLAPAIGDVEAGDAGEPTWPGAAETPLTSVAPADAAAADDLLAADLEPDLAPMRDADPEPVRETVREPRARVAQASDPAGGAPDIGPVRTTFRNDIAPAAAPPRAVSAAVPTVPSVRNAAGAGAQAREPERDLLGDVKNPAVRPGDARSPKRRRTVAERASEAGPPAAASVPAGPQELIVMHVICREFPGFSGDRLVNAVSRLGLKYGDMNIFHRIHGGSQDGGTKPRRVVFSMASAVEPGSFDLSTIADTKIPGVSFFLQLPGPVEALEAFEDMLAVARDLALTLHGDLKDENQSVMTGQTVEHYRERVRDFARKQQIRG